LDWRVAIRGPGFRHSARILASLPSQQGRTWPSPNRANRLPGRGRPACHRNPLTALPSAPEFATARKVERPAVEHVQGGVSPVARDWVGPATWRVRRASARRSSVSTSTASSAKPVQTHSRSWTATHPAPPARRCSGPAQKPPSRERLLHSSCGQGSSHWPLAWPHDREAWPPGPHWPPSGSRLGGRLLGRRLPPGLGRIGRRGGRLHQPLGEIPLGGQQLLGEPKHVVDDLLGRGRLAGRGR
jgi:hypothetical protein